MPIRGRRNAFPSPGGTPTGMFSSRGKQKMDPTEGYDKKLNSYALKHGGEVAVKAGSDKSLRSNQAAQPHSLMKAPSGKGPDLGKVGKNPGGSPKSPQCSPRSKKNRSPQRIK